MTSVGMQVVSTLQHLLRLEPGCRLVDFGAGACKLASQLHRSEIDIMIVACSQLSDQKQEDWGWEEGVGDVFSKTVNYVFRAGGLKKPVLCVEPSPEMLEVFVACV